MIITYFRSSSFNAYDNCPQSFFLEYNLGLKNKTNKAAEKGTIVHKVMEILAMTNIHLSKGETTFYEPELRHTFDATTCWPDDVVELVYNEYIKKSPNVFVKKDLKECKEWTWKALQYRDGMYDPRKLNVKGVEVHFDFPMEQDWAKYSYDLPNGENISGPLRLKGTVDLVTEPAPGVLEFVDWKTGRQSNFATGEDKDYDKLTVDPQLRIYHYALKKMYPEYHTIIATIFFINYDGPFSICFTNQDKILTEEMLKKRFNEIRKNQTPRLIKSWKCTKTCRFGIDLYPGSQDTVCEFMRKKVQARGMDHVLSNYSNGTYDHLTKYGEGGGRTDRLTEPEKEV